MRITGGELCGRIIQCPPGIIRPAMDRMRESLFSVIGDMPGLSFLDLFSGSGVIGLEAYSRGARPVRCVEKDLGKRDIMRKNFLMAGPEIEASFLPVERFIMSWKESFALIFLDPPFNYKHKQQLLERICASKLLSPYSRVLMHFPKEDKVAEGINSKGSTGPKGKGFKGERSLHLIDRREYGRSIVHIYETDFALPMDETL